MSQIVWPGITPRGRSLSAQTESHWRSARASYTLPSDARTGNHRLRASSQVSRHASSPTDSPSPDAPTAAHTAHTAVAEHWAKRAGRMSGRRLHTESPLNISPNNKRVRIAFRQIAKKHDDPCTTQRRAV